MRHTYTQRRFLLEAIKESPTPKLTDFQDSEPSDDGDYNSLTENQKVNLHGYLADFAKMSKGEVSVGILVAPVASDRTCDPVAATETKVATEAATEPPCACDRKNAEACDRACDRQRPKKRGQQLLRPGVFSHLVETKRLRPNCDRCDRDRDRATGATKIVVGFLWAGGP